MSVLSPGTRCSEAQGSDFYGGKDVQFQLALLDRLWRRNLQDRPYRLLVDADTSDACDGIN